MKPATILTAFLAVAPAAAGAAATPAFAQSAKPKWSVGSSVEVQDPQEGRWYAARVDKFDKKTGAYTVLLLGLNEKVQVTEDKIRAQGGGEVVDLKFIEARAAFKTRRAEFDKALKSVPWGNEANEKEIREKHAALEAMIADMTAKWPKEDLSGAVGLLAKYKAEIDAKAKATTAGGADAAAGAALTAEEAAALEAYYKPIHDAVRYFPSRVSADTILDSAEAFEALRLPEIDARVAADKAKAPGVFKYYGGEEKGRYADLEFGGPSRPNLAPASLATISTQYLPKIFEAKAKVIAGEGELAKAVKAAIARGPSVDRAKQAVRLAKALHGCRPGAPGLQEALAEAEANLARAEAAEKAPPTAAAPAKPATGGPSAAPKSPTVDVSKIDSGVELTFSTNAVPGSAAAASFKAGDFVFAHARFPAPVVKALTNPVVTDNVFFTLFLSENGKELEYTSIGVRTTHLFGEQSAGQAGALVLPIVSNPDEDCFVYANNLFNYSTWQALAALPPGEHTLDARLESSAPKAEGVPLAVGKLKVTITPEGVAAWKKNAALVEKAFYARGGEIVKLGLQVEGPDGWKIVTRKGGVRTTYRHGRFEGKDFWIGIGLFGKKGSDHYAPSGGATIFVKRVEGGYQVERGGQALAKFAHDGTITDRNGKPWGKVTNEWDTVTGAGDLLDLVAGLHHFGDLLK